MAAGTGRADTTGLAVVSGLAAAKTDKTAQLTWTNGVTDLAIEILIATPVTDPRGRIGTVLAGSTKFDIIGLTPNTAYRAEVRYSLVPFPGTGVTVDFTTDASPTTPTAPQIGAIAIVR